MSTYLLKPSNAGIYQINALNVNTLFIEGVPFQTFISELVSGDQLEQGEIDEIKQVLLYLNTSGLTTEWVVGNNNINAAIKTALDTLTGRVDGNDTSIGTINTNLGTLNTKTQYQTSVQGNDGASTASTFQVSINDRVKRQMSLSTGTNSISSINNSSTQGSTGNYNQNRILLQAANGQVWSYAHLNTLEAIDKIEIGSAFGVGAQTAVNIGARNNRINIGSIDAPEVGATTTEITIGYRGVANNTTCNLQGNFFTPNARWESLTKSSALTWTQLLSLISTSGLPLWVASFALSSSIPNFSYSDLWSMKAVEEAGGLIKNGEVETTKGAKLKTLTVFDTEVGVDLVPKEGTFFAKGHISKTTLLGDIKMQTFNGEILLKANNISPSNINWALTEAMDNVNALKISNNDVELIAGSGADGSQLRISNTTGGPIKLRVGTGKLQANAHDALNVFNTQATSQVQIGNAATTANRYDATTKLIVDQTQLTDGIKVCKDAGSVTRINHDNITTPSINVTTLVPTTITGWDVKSLAAGSGISLSSNAGVYTINSSGSGGGGSGGGTTFILTNATSVTNTSPTNTLTTTYSSTALTTITRNAYTANTTYAMGEFKSGYLLSSANLVLSGSYTADLFGLLTANQASYLFSKLYHVVERATPSTQFIVDKSLIYTTGSNTTNYQLLKTKPIPVPAADCSITLYKVVIPALNVIASPTGAETITLTCRLVSKNNGTETTQYTFPVVVTGTNLGDITFQVSGGSTTIDMFNLQSFYFTLTLTDNFMTSSQMRQALMRSNTDIVYKLAATTKTLIYNGTSNRTTLTNGVSTIYQLEMPFSFNSYDISDYTDYSKIQFEPFFIQPSGSTSGHSFVLSFQDGALSHLSTSISSTGASTLAQVLTAGNTANTSINMNSNNITNVGTIAPTAITGWNVKSINPGAGISVANVSGAITISATTSPNDSEPAMLIASATALPTKPFWYNTQYSWLYNATNVNTADTYYDSCVSSTGQYQILVAVDRIRSSVDWGVNWYNQNFTSFSLRGCCITGSGNRYYLNGQYRVFYFDAIYSTFGSGGNYLTSFPTLSGGATYTKIACSQDGKHILVGVAGGTATIFKSNDYGFTTLQVDTQGVAGISINDVAMSADGKYQFAMFSYTATSPPIQGRVMYSTNYGVTWNSPTMPENGSSIVLNGITCSATGQYVLALRPSVGMFISSDYGKNYIYSSNANTIYPTGGCCMSANGQFQLVNAVDRIYFSEDYGRTFLSNSTSLLGSPSTPDLYTIACSSTGGYAVAAGASGRSWVIYDVPTDVRQLVAGSNMTITPNGFGTYTLASTGGSSASILAPHYTTTVTLNSSGLTTITLPSTGVNLNDYDIDLRINMTFANSGSGYTFFAIQYNGYYNGASTWTNHRNQGIDFANTSPNNGYPSIGATPGGFYMQSYLNPYFGFILPFDSASSIQFLSSKITINKTNYTSTTYAPIMTKFSTTVGAVNSTPVTANDRIWNTDGMIQSGQNNGTGGFPEIRTISISMANQARDQYSGVPCQFVVWLKRRT